MSKKFFILVFVLFAFIRVVNEAIASDLKPENDLGNPVSHTIADYTIVVSPKMKYINVNNGDTVLFKIGDRDFSWHFDTFRDFAIFPLSKIAPLDINLGETKVYVAKDPRMLN
jgi:hypothetical protein